MVGPIEDLRCFFCSCRCHCCCYCYCYCFAAAVVVAVADVVALRQLLSLAWIIPWVGLVGMLEKKDLSVRSFAVRKCEGILVGEQAEDGGRTIVPAVEWHHVLLIQVSESGKALNEE